MFITPSGQLYYGDLQEGDREATAGEITAYELARQPSVKEVTQAEIRAIEAPHADAMVKVNRLAAMLALETGTKMALLLASQPAKTDTEVKAYLYATNKSYKIMADLETAITPLRALMQ
jgi:hypothetical protein